MIIHSNHEIDCKTDFCISLFCTKIIWIQRGVLNSYKLRNKKIAILCVGASPYDESAFAEIKAYNLTGDLKDIPLFYGRGAWDESKMKFMDRTLCKMLQKSVAKKNPDTHEPWMKALMCAVGQSCDWTDEKYLLPLIDYLEK